MAERSHEVTIRHALFAYQVDGTERLAMRGDTVKVDEDDFERGSQFGAFVVDEADLAPVGALPELDLDELDPGEVRDWMRSAAITDVSTILSTAAAEGLDIAAALLAGEQARGSEARPDVIALLEGDAPATGPASDRVEDVIDWVGDDAERALTALEIEDAKGDKARKTLVEKLEAIVEAGEE